MKSDLQKHTEAFFKLSSACNGRIPSKMSVATAMGRITKMNNNLNPNRMLAHRVRCLELQLIVGDEAYDAAVDAAQM